MNFDRAGPSKVYPQRPKSVGTLYGPMSLPEKEPLLNWFKRGVSEEMLMATLDVNVAPLTPSEH